MKNQHEDKDKNKKRKWLLLLLLLLLLLFGGYLLHEHKDEIADTPIGDFIIQDEPNSNDDTDSLNDVGYIEFAGFTKCTVSKKKPSIELKNPDGNFVDMVFTLYDSSTNEIIARTPKVKSGEYVYVDIYNYFNESGTHTINVSISTFDSVSGTQMNGLNQELEISIQ